MNKSLLTDKQISWLLRWCIINSDIMPIWRIGHEVIKMFTCSTQVSMKFQVLIKNKMLKNKTLLALKLSDAVFILLINAKMPTIVGILTFISRINFMLS